MHLFDKEMISFSAPNVINIFIFLDHLPFLRLVVPVLFGLGDQYAKSLFIVLSKACIHVLICHLLRLVSLFVKFFPVLFSKKHMGFLKGLHIT